MKKNKKIKDFTELPLWQQIAVFAFGVIFIIALLVIAIFFPEPTPFQYIIFRVVLSLAAAGIGAMLPGFITAFVNIKNPIIKLGVRGGGALALFAITYFFNPAAIVIEEPVKPPVTTGSSVPIDLNYYPSGKMGDINDVTIAQGVNNTRFIYETKGRSPHEWEYKFVGGKLNPDPAQFAGVMYLEPQNNFGTDPTGGFDLRELHRLLKWEARSLKGEVNVEFLIGGVNWVWKNMTRVPAPNPGSLPKLSLGIRKLTKDWKTFEYYLSQRPEREFRRVIGGFGWVINWGSNGIKLNEDKKSPDQVKTFEIEIRNARYES